MKARITIRNKMDTIIAMNVKVDLEIKEMVNDNKTYMFLCKGDKIEIDHISRSEPLKIR